MIDLQRRRLLQSASILLGSACVRPVFGDDAARLPAFAEKPSFDPAALFLTWQHDPTTTMTIQWIGSRESGAERPIWYSQDGAMQWQRTVGTSRPYPMSDLHVHRTELKGLQPDTEYRFRVGLDSAERRFRTMPAKATNAIQFVSGGDSGIGEAAGAINRLAAAQAPGFVLLGGDLAYENGLDGKVFLQFLNNYASHLIDESGRLIPLLACIGNHEVRGGYEKTRADAPFFYAVFDGLFADTGYAAVDFGDYMSLILLDSNHTSPIDGAQEDWLATQLKQREECPNLFVFYHVPSYPSFRDPDMDDGEKGTGAASRKHWVPLFERYNVDAVFEHHDHTFKRTHPLMDGRVDPNGICYLGDGSWGKLRRPKTPEQRPYLAVSHEAYHLSLHRIEGHQRFHVALSDHGKVVDVCTTRKRART
jgi:acid phosphatase type 7